MQVIAPLYPKFYDFGAWGLLVAGCVTAFSVAPIVESKRRGFLKLFAWVLTGTGLALLGYTGILANKRTPILRVTGSIVSLYQGHGKNAHSTIRVQTEKDVSPQLETNYVGNSLRIGQTVDVTYQEYSGNIQSLQVLDGIFVGTKLGAWNSLSDSQVGIDAGILVIAFGLIQWLIHRKGEVKE